MKPSSILVAVAVGLAAMAGAPSASAQAPNLSGVWLVDNSVGGPQGGKMTQWMRQDPPFTPEGLARFNANKPGKGPRQAPPAFGNDPLGDANPPGLLRTLVYPRPIDIIQLPDRIVQLFEYAHFWRTIWTDGRAVPDDSGALLVRLLGGPVGGRHAGGADRRPGRPRLARRVGNTVQRGSEDHRAVAQGGRENHPDDHHRGRSAVPSRSHGRAIHGRCGFSRNHHPMARCSR